MYRPTKALMLEDDYSSKGMDVKRALIACGIRDVIWERDQEAGFERIRECDRQGVPIQLIVTDMRYPLRAGMEHDSEAGFKLLERLKQEGIHIPVIICSTSNYENATPEILGAVWYNPNRDLNWDFKKVLEKEL